MGIDTKSFNPEERQESSREKNVTTFLETAKKALGEEYNAMEIEDVVSYLDDEGVKKWTTDLNELSGNIEFNKKNLTEKDITVQKAKFIGMMTMYASLYQDRNDAKSYREMEK